MKKIISFWEKLQKSRRPSSKSYLTVKESIEDPLVTAKLQFFSFVSIIVEQYLRKYQTDKPMIPFVYFDLKDLVIKLLDIIVKPTVINNCKSGKQLKEIDLSNEENLISVGKINMGFAVEDIIRRLKQQDKVSLSQLKAFKEGAQQFVISMLEKLFEKSALVSVVLRSASVFDPFVMCELSKEKLQERWEHLLKHLIHLAIIAPSRCDQAMAEFKSFQENEVKKIWHEFSGFCSKESRLDDFYFKTVGIGKYKELSFVLKLLLTVSHGQASVERGFSHNSAVLKTNMSPETVIAKRMIKDHILSNDLKPYTIEISKPLVLAFKSARQKYEIHLEEERKSKQRSKAEQRAMIMEADIDKLRVQRRQLEKTVDMMEEEFVECMRLAEDKNDLSLVYKGNGLKRESSEIKDTMKVIDKELHDLEEKKR